MKKLNDFGLCVVLGMAMCGGIFSWINELNRRGLNGQNPIIVIIGTVLLSGLMWLFLIEPNHD